MRLNQDEANSMSILWIAFVQKPREKLGRAGLIKLNVLEKLRRTILVMTSTGGIWTMESIHHWAGIHLMNLNQMIFVLVDQTFLNWRT